jgi:hypothetical protein
LFADICVSLYIGRCNVQIGVQDVTSAALLPVSENLLQGIGLLKNNVWITLH